MRSRITAALAALGMGAAGLMGFMATVSRSAEPSTPLPPDEVFRLIDEDAAKPRFNGTVGGWRIGTYQALQSEGLTGRNLQAQTLGTGLGLPVGCQVQQADAQTPTALDLTPTYFPASAEVVSEIGPEKWVCGDTALSVATNYELDTPYGEGFLMVERALWGSRTFEMNAPADRVESGSIDGHQAILVHCADDATGLGQAEILVIEDNDLDPFATVLHIVGDGIPFSELKQLAEGL